jgi:hypothetical protein
VEGGWVGSMTGEPSSGRSGSGTKEMDKEDGRRTLLRRGGTCVYLSGRGWWSDADGLLLGLLLLFDSPPGCLLALSSASACFSIHASISSIPLIPSRLSRSDSACSGPSFPTTELAKLGVFTETKEGGRAGTGGESLPTLNGSLFSLSLLAALCADSAINDSI